MPREVRIFGKGQQRAVNALDPSGRHGFGAEQVLSEGAELGDTQWGSPQVLERLSLRHRREGLAVEREVSLGSFYSGMFRSKEMSGPAALSLVTAAPRTGRPAPYEDEFDEVAGRLTYRFRRARWSHAPQRSAGIPRRGDPATAPAR
jgi:hypothetical protein